MSAPPPPAPEAAQHSAEQRMHSMYRSMLNIQESTLLMLLNLTGALEFFAAVGLCDSLGRCDRLYGWALSAGIVSLGFSIPLVVLLHKRYDWYDRIASYVCGFLFFWWICGAGITTFAGPFFTVGNGYIGAWGAFLSSFLLAHGRLAGMSFSQLRSMAGVGGRNNSQQQEPGQAPPPPEPQDQPPASSNPHPPPDRQRASYPFPEDDMKGGGPAEVPHSQV